jgi:hypothetical protein
VIEAALALWRFLSRPPGRYLASALIVMGGLIWVHADGYRAGRAAERQAVAAREIAAARQLARVAQASASISASARADNAAALAQIRTLTLKLQQKVPTYVSPQADRRCVVPVGYVRLRDAAGAGLDPVAPAAGGSLDADSGLVLSDLAENDIANAAAFNAATEEVRAWRAWYARQADLWAKSIRAPAAGP